MPISAVSEGHGAPGIYTTDGDIAGTITIAGDFDARSSDPAARPLVKVLGTSRKLSGTVVIGGKLLGNSGSNYAFNLPADGLSGQIIINGLNSGTGPWWTAPIRIDGITLDSAATDANYLAPYYGVDSGTLGGGAVGVVPYHLYKNDCEPQYADSESCEGIGTQDWSGIGGETRETIVLRHYGPVFNSNGSYVPLRVYRRSVVACNCEGDDWDQNEITDECDVHVFGSGTRAREVWVSHKLDIHGDPVSLGYYSFKVDLAVDGGSTPYLRCGGTSVSPTPAVAGYPYYFIPICASRPGPP